MNVRNGLALALLLTSCTTTGVLGPAPDWRAVRSADRADVTLDQMADQLAELDVVFLGELHDDDTGHELQYELFRRLVDRRGDVVLSLEMFERDVQELLDDYLAGEIDEETMLAESRPWSNYAEHYRPVVELARERGLPVLAANIPRPLASSVAKEGVGVLESAEHAPREVETRLGAYWFRFSETMSGMGSHGGFDDEMLAKWYAAQCSKDDAMAEAIADHLWEVAPARPLVVHLCGRFHSDWRLGTVERLFGRRPDLALGTVTMVRVPALGDELDDEELRAADYVWVVRE